MFKCKPAKRFRTSTNEYIKNLREIFYPKNTKIFPYKYLIENNNFNEESLAYWFCDDGYWSKGSSTFCTDNFSLNDHYQIQKLLLKKFGINTRLWNKHKKTRIGLIRSETKKFFSLIEPYIIPSMLYKIGK